MYLHKTVKHIFVVCLVLVVAPIASLISMSSCYPGSNDNHSNQIIKLEKQGQFIYNPSKYTNSMVTKTDLEGVKQFLDDWSLRERIREKESGRAICKAYANNVILKGQLLSISKYLRGKYLLYKKYFKVHKLDKYIYNLHPNENNLYWCTMIHMDFINPKNDTFLKTEITLESVKSSIVLFCNQAHVCK